MTKRPKKPGQALTGKQDYDVGYGRPPKATQFKPGQSANPNGRPKGSKNKVPGPHEERMKEIILEEGYRDITVRDGDRLVTMPLVQAVMRSLGVDAVKGRPPSARLFLELLAAVESSRKIENDEWMRTAIDYKIGAEEELEHYQKLGITDFEEPLPHPDHIHIDFENGTVEIVGPVTKEQKKAYDWLVEQCEKYRETLKSLIKDRSISTDEDEIALIDQDIATLRRYLEVIESGLP